LIGRRVIARGRLRVRCGAPSGNRTPARLPLPVRRSLTETSCAHTAHPYHPSSRPRTIEGGRAHRDPSAIALRAPGCAQGGPALVCRSIESSDATHTPVTGQRRPEPTGNRPASGRGGVRASRDTTREPGGPHHTAPGAARVVGAPCEDTSASTVHRCLRVGALPHRILHHLDETSLLSCDTLRATRWARLCATPRCGAHLGTHGYTAHEGT